LQDADEEGKLIVFVPEFDEISPGEWSARRESVERYVSKEEFIDILSDIQDLKPDMPLFEMVRVYFRNPKELCVTAFGDPEFEMLVKMESRASEYHVLPFEGGQLDQPLVVLEAMDIIARTSILYQIQKEVNLEEATNRNKKLENMKAGLSRSGKK